MDIICITDCVTVFLVICGMFNIFLVIVMTTELSPRMLSGADNKPFSVVQIIKTKRQRCCNRANF